jgi:hypothetical protein
LNAQYNRELQRHLQALMKAAGYKKERATWRRVGHEAISVLNIQGSQFGPTLYINLGSYFRALGTDSRPLECNCHLRNRLSSTGIVPDPMRITQLLEFSGVYGQNIPDEVRYREIVLAVEQYGLPWLERCSTHDGARTQIEKGGGFVAGELRAHLGCIDEPELE